MIRIAKTGSGYAYNDNVSSDIAVKLKWKDRGPHDRLSLCYGTKADNRALQKVALASGYLLDYTGEI